MPRQHARPGMDTVMRHHRAAWRVERAGWCAIALLLLASLLGAFGDGLLSRGHAGSPQALAVEYGRILRASAPTEYRVKANPALAVDGVLRVRIDTSLVDVMEVESIVPEPVAQTAGDGHVEFAFRVAPASRPADIVFRLRPATFGRHRGRISLAGQPPVLIEHLVYP